MDKVSVVIPSLGNSIVLKTIEVLNSGSLIPEEILLCVPEGTQLDLSAFNNCKLIFCKKRSQVAQRAQGLSLAKNDFVLQLDDDTLLSGACLENLVHSLKKLNIKAAIAPAILDLATGESIYKNEERNSFLRNAYLYLINGRKKYKPGTITLVGSSFGPHYSLGSKKLIEVESLAGCCVLHHRENLICDDYFIFEGKAYGEDLIASYLYQLKGIKFYVDNSATCLTPALPPNSVSVRELIKDLRSKFYYLFLSKKLGFRFCFYCFIKVVRELILSFRLNFFRTCK